MLDWSQCLAVERAPERVSGAWVFTGTRVPVRARPMRSGQQEILDGLELLEQPMPVAFRSDHGLR